jgi:DNA phosphorothioation-dependent restriction protein DptG
VLDVKKLTDNQFENLSQLFMHQYNQAFEEILSWHDPLTYEDGRSQLVKERTPNFDLVIETLVQAFADKSWSIFEGSDGDRNNGQPRRR